MIKYSFLGPYTGWNQDITVYAKKLQIMWQKRDPWGDLSAPKATLDSIFLSSLSDLLNICERIRITNAPNHFKSAFGSAYFISKNNEIKLAKPTKKEPRKASFPWDLGFLFCSQLEALIVEYWNYWTANETTLTASYEFFNKTTCETKAILARSLEIELYVQNKTKI